MTTIKFSPDVTMLASGGVDKTLRLWDVASHRQLGPPLTDQTAAVEAVAFSPDGRTVASGDDDARVTLWSNDPIDTYINRLCSYVGLPKAREVFARAEPSIDYRQPCR